MQSKIQKRLEKIVNAVSNPVKTWKGTKSGVAEWGSNLINKDPTISGFALGQGLEFSTELLIPIKGLQVLKSSSMALYEGNKIISNALKGGVKIIVAKSVDDLQYLEAMGAKALYMGGEGTKGSILVSENASRIQILEEAIHHEQRMQFGDKFFYDNVSKLEVAAQSKLLLIGKKEGWKASDIKDIEKAKSTWQKNVLLCK